MPDLERATAQQTTGCFGSYYGRQIVFLRKRGDHFACAGRVLVDQQNNAPMKTALAKPLSDDKDGFLHKGISRCQPEESRLASRNPSKTSELLFPIATLLPLSRQPVAHFQFSTGQ